MIFGEPREVRTLEQANALIEEWAAAYRQLWLAHMKLNERLIDARQELERAEVRAMVERGERWLRAHPVPFKFRDEVDA